MYARENFFKSILKTLLISVSLKSFYYTLVELLIYFYAIKSLQMRAFDILVPLRRKKYKNEKERQTEREGELERERKKDR